MHIDQYSGKVLEDIGAGRTGAIGRITEWGVSVHQGGEYRTPNLIIMLAGCLALIVLCLAASSPGGRDGATAGWPRRHASNAIG